MTRGGLLKRLALGIGRTAEDAKRLDDPRAQRAKRLFYLTVLVGLSAIFLPSLWRAFGPTHAYRPQILVPASAWHLVYEPKLVPCPYEAAGTACLAAPENGTLWKSPRLRSDADKGSRMFRRMGKRFWMGAELPASLLAEAHRLQANRFILGWIQGTYRIWLDGHYLTGTDGWHETEPVTFTIPMSRLGQSRPVRLAIQIEHDTGRDDPDFFNGLYDGEGFATTARFNDYKAVNGLYVRSRPFALLIAYSLLARVFFIFWLSARSKPEYFYIALHTLATAFADARLIDLVWAGISPEVNGMLSVGLEFYEAAFGLLLGFAFARLRHGVFRIGLPIALLTPVLLIVAAPDPASLHDVQHVVQRWFAPAAYAVGGLACLLQLVAIDARANPELRVRRRRLTAFGLGLVALAALYGFAHHAHFEASMRAWLGVEHLAFMLYFGLIALREYRETARRASRTPVSDYHRREVLPDRLSGALLVADFKAPPGHPDRAKAAHSNEQVATVWRSHFYSAIHNAGGVVIHHKGEELIAFFDSDRCPEPVVSALEVLERVDEASKLLDIEYKRRRRAFCFRAAVVRGDIRPIWEDMGETREPYWEEAGETTPFVEASRLLEIEREVLSQEKADSLASFVLLRESVARGLVSLEPGYARRFLLRGAPARDKHGQPYEVAVYVTEGSPVAAADEKRAA